MLRRTGLYLYHALSPYPQADMKFYYSKDDVDWMEWASSAMLLGLQQHLTSVDTKKAICFFSSVDTTMKAPS